MLATAGGIEAEDMRMARGGRRLARMIAAAITTATVATALAGAPGAQAADTFFGRLYDPLTFATVGSVTVAAEPVGGGSAASTTSGADGSFSLTVTDAAEYVVRIDGAAAGYGAGYLQVVSVTSSPVIVLDRASATVFTPRELGDILLTEGRFTGTVVDASTGSAVAGATATLSGGAGSITVATNASGGFTFVTFGTGYTLAVDGSALGYEAGFVTATAEAQGIGVGTDPAGAALLNPGELGRVALDRVAAPPAGSAPRRVEHLRLRSTAAGSITVTFRAPRSGAPATSYVLTCATQRRGRHGSATVTQTLTASGQTVNGFTAGRNQCSLVARNAAGDSRAVTESVQVR